MPTVTKTYASCATAPVSKRRQAAGAAGPVVLMVSGGADSTALLVLACTAELDIADGRGLDRVARERLHVLHVNHRLRGEAADADEAYVRKLCQDYGLPITVERVDVASLAAKADDGSNIENVAREVRYKAANELANNLCAQLNLARSTARIVTAHTANDRAETFFMNAIKGSGAQGLSSIPRRRNRIVRPLLDYTHDQLCSFLKSHNIAWREDATNADTHYLRAYVRHEIVPRALERNPRLLENLSNSCDILADEDIYLTQLAARAFRVLELRRTNGLIALDASRLAATEVVLARRVVRMAASVADPNCRLDASHVAAVLEIVAAGAGSVTLPGALDARVVSGLLTIRKTSVQQKNVSGWLEVAPLGGSLTSTAAADPGPTTHIALSMGIITARLREAVPGSDPVAYAKAHAHEWNSSSVLLDAEACGLGVLGGKLWIEAPGVGETLCPLGMHGQSKKLSDLLIDEKIPADMRSQVPVVRTGPKGQIVWVAPIRADERSRVTSSSRVLLELHFRGENFGREGIFKIASVSDD